MNDYGYAVLATGTLIKLGDGATPTENFATVAEVKSITGPTLVVDSLDVTSHPGAAATVRRKFIPGLVDEGTVTFDINFLPGDATHDITTGLKSIIRQIRTWQIVFPDDGSTTWTFTGFLTNFEIGAPVDNVLTGSVTIKVASAVTDGAAPPGGGVFTLLANALKFTAEYDHSDDSGENELAGADAAGRFVVVQAVCTETLAGDTPPTFDVGEDGDEDKFLDQLVLAGAVAGDIFYFAGTLTATEEVLVTVTAGSGGTPAGKFAVTVLIWPAEA